MSISDLQFRLDREGIAFWKNRDYSKAIITLNKLRKFWGNDFSLYDNKTLLNGNVQLISYLGRNELNIENINPNITYQFLINDFADYWNQQAKDFKDYQKKLDALVQVNLFESIIKGLSKTFDFFSNPIILFASLGIVLLYLIKK